MKKEAEVAEKPLVSYKSICSSGMWVCEGCHGMNSGDSESCVIHNPDCPHYPTKANLELEERLKEQGLFVGSKWDR